MGFPQLRAIHANPLAGKQPTYPIFADPATYTLTGADVTLIGATRITASAGSYAETGSDVAFVHTIPKDVISLLPRQKWYGGYPRAFHPSLRKPIRQAGVVAYALTSEGTTYTWTGTDVTLTVAAVAAQALGRQPTRDQAWPRPFAPGPWGHLTHQRSANRIGTSATAFFGFDAEGATYTLSGGDAALRTAYVFDSQGTAYVVLVPEAFLPVTLPADGTSVVLTGSRVALIQTASGGVVTVTFRDAGLSLPGPGTIFNQQPTRQRYAYQLSDTRWVSRRIN